MFLQLAVVLAAAAVVGLIWGGPQAASVGIGGVTCAIPQLYFARRFFAATGALATKQIVRGMYRAEMIKLLLTGLLFMVVFKYLPIDVPAFFLGFLLAQLTAWVSPLIMKFNTVG